MTLSGDSTVPAAAIHAAPRTSSPMFALQDAAALMQKLVWSVAEAAFMCCLSQRTVWRLMADPNSKFPKPRRIRGRTLLHRDDVLKFMSEGGSR